jgi:hypothetical protein
MSPNQREGKKFFLFLNSIKKNFPAKNRNPGSEEMLINLSEAAENSRLDFQALWQHHKDDFIRNRETLFYK